MALPKALDLPDRRGARPELLVLSLGRELAVAAEPGRAICDAAAIGLPSGQPDHTSCRIDCWRARCSGAVGGPRGGAAPAPPSAASAKQSLLRSPSSHAGSIADGPWLVQLPELGVVSDRVRVRLASDQGFDCGFCWRSPEPGMPATSAWSPRSWRRTSTFRWRWSVWSVAPCSSRPT